MARNTLIISTFVSLGFFASTAASATLAYSSFDSGNEGWIAQQGPAGSPYNVTWNAAGGNSGGYITYWDQTSTDSEWFSASSSFLGGGDFSQAVNNGGVSFDWMADIGTGGQLVQIAFTTIGGQSVLWAETVATVNGHWYHYDFSFDSSTAWMLQSSGNPATLATTSDLTDVLSSVGGMFVTGDTIDGMDGTCSLDNPMIYSIPAPGVLGLCGLASIVGMRRRR